jgi:Fic family protein
LHTNLESLQISEETILSLHKIMLSETNMPCGVYKEHDNVIMETGYDGSRIVRFAPTPAAETAETMERLILAYMAARDDSDISSLLLIPCFALDFLCMHPFSDGNGRISRLLSLLLLHHKGFDVIRYVLFEALIYYHTRAYYQAVQNSSIDWHAARNNHTPFKQNFLMTLLLSYREFDKHFAAIQSGHVSKSARIEHTVLNSLLPITKSGIYYIFFPRCQSVDS